MHYTRLLLLTLLSCLQLALFAQIDMQAHVASDEGKDAYDEHIEKQIAYYTDNYTYANLIALTNDALFERINTLMGNTNNITDSKFSYGALRYAYVGVDYDLNNKNNIICYYDGCSISATWDGSSYNREHVWPQSFGAAENSPMGYDMQSVRPCLVSTNSSRNNKGYGETKGANIYDPDQSTNKNYSNYNPQNLGSYRGDAARMIMYDYLVYGQAGSHKNTLYNGKAQLLQSFGTSDEKIFESLRIMLKWHMQDPPSLTEMVRNDGAQDYQGNRNPLIDYPELAIQVFLDDGITTYTVNETSSATMNPAHRYTLSDGFIAYLTNNDGSHPQDIKVTGANYTYDATLGRLTITNVTGNMTISDVAAATYTLTWNANGGQLSGTYTSGSIAPGTKITAPTATRNGYDFIGWSPNFTGTMPSANTTYTAQWQAQATYTVTWMANGSVHSTRTYNANGTQSLILPADPTPCDGWTFVGWTTEPDYSNPFCQPSDLFTTASGKVTSDATYYAVFKKQ